MFSKWFQYTLIIYRIGFEQGRRDIAAGNQFGYHGTTRKEVPMMDENKLPMILTPQDISAVLGISRNKAYEVVHSTGFPGFRIGKQYRVHRDKFLDWLNTVKEVA